MSLRAQKVLIWWTWVWGAIFFLDLRFLLHMLPPPTARWSAAEIARFYLEHGGEIRLGATIAGLTSGCMLPIVIVIGLQIYRHERGKAPVWTILGVAGGALMTVTFILPPIFFGAAAFNPERSADVIAMMHQLGVLTFVTTDQFYVFLWVAIVVTSLTPNSVPHSPFPRWFGYFTAWMVLLSEVSAVAFLTRVGPFAWNGLLAFWVPLMLFAAWMPPFTVLLIKAINAQMDDELSPTAVEMSAVP